MQVFARDADSGANSEIRFDLSSLENIFEMDSVTGILRTTRGLDREIPV